MKKIFLACLLCILPWSASQAEMKTLFSAGVGQLSWEDDDADFSVDPVNLLFRGGVAFNEYIDVGVEWSTTLIDEKTDNVEFDIDVILVFAKFNLPITESVDLYALGGISSIAMTVNQREGVRVGTFDESGSSFGFGVQYGSRDDGKFMIEYISYFKDDKEFDELGGDFTLSSINFGYIGYF